MHSSSIHNTICMVHISHTQYRAFCAISVLKLQTLNQYWFETQSEPNPNTTRIFYQLYFRIIFPKSLIKTNLPPDVQKFRFNQVSTHVKYLLIIENLFNSIFSILYFQITKHTVHCQNFECLREPKWGRRPSNPIHMILEF